jgi:hypothetical protein
MRHNASASPHKNRQPENGALSVMGTRQNLGLTVSVAGDTPQVLNPQSLLAEDDYVSV